MAINEKIVTGRKFRRLIDKESKLWQRISYWTKACDVEFDDSKTAEEKIASINGDLTSINKNLKRIPQFIIDEKSGKITGYKTEAGADTVFPFKQDTSTDESKPITTGKLAGSGKGYSNASGGDYYKTMNLKATIDMSSIEGIDYKSLSVDDFTIVYDTITTNCSVKSGLDYFHPIVKITPKDLVRQYDATTGILTLEQSAKYRTNTASDLSSASASIDFSVYL